VLAATPEEIPNAKEYSRVSAESLFEIGRLAFGICARGARLHGTS
jgi:hypothetical protein